MVSSLVSWGQVGHVVWVLVGRRPAAVLLLGFAGGAGGGDGTWHLQVFMAGRKDAAKTCENVSKCLLAKRWQYVWSFFSHGQYAGCRGWEGEVYCEPAK